MQTISTVQRVRHTRRKNNKLLQQDGNLKQNVTVDICTVMVPTQLDNPSTKYGHMPQGQVILTKEMKCRHSYSSSL